MAKHKFYKKPPITLIKQLMSLKSKYKSGFCKSKNLYKFEWIQGMKPTSLSKSYEVKIIYDFSKTNIKIILENQGIVLKDGEKIKHTYKSNYNDGNDYIEICLYYVEWNKTKYIADTIIPWASEWLYFYELWRITGEWLGGGIEHEK